MKNTTGSPASEAVNAQMAKRVAQNNMTKTGGRRRRRTRRRRLRRRSLRRRYRGGDNVPQFANGGQSNDAIVSAARTEARLKNLKAIQ